MMRYGKNVPLELWLTIVVGRFGAPGAWLSILACIGGLKA